MKVLLAIASLMVGSLAFGLAENNISTTDQSPLKPHVGATVGAAALGGYSNSDVTAAIGVDVGMQVAPYLGVALDASYSRDVTMDTAEFKDTRETIPVLAEVGYHFDDSIAGGYLKHFHVAGRTGALIENTRVHDATINDTHSDTKVGYVIGPALGYDHFVSRTVSAGLKGSYLFSMADGQSDLAKGDLVVKYWF